MVQSNTVRLDQSSNNMGKSTGNVAVRDLMRQYIRNKCSSKDSQTLDLSAFGSKRSKYDVRQNISLAVPILQQQQSKS